MQDSQDPLSGTYSFAGFTLDLRRGMLLSPAAREIPLRPKSFVLLRTFVENAGKLLDRDTLMAAVWPGIFVTDESLAQCVKDVRRALGDERQGLLRTVVKRGYILVAEVTRGQPATDRALVADANSHPPVAMTPGPPPSGEKRQVTALSTELILPRNASPIDDPEELRPLIDAYWHHVLTAVAQQGGTISHHVGRGVLAYFGHPIAQEDAAERAIHAGLALVNGQTDYGRQPAPVIRVGIATGLVVAEATGELFGNAPSDAARMRDLAAPGQVVVATGTRQLAGRLFTYSPIRPAAHGGSAAAWQVLGPGTASSRSETLYEARLSPLIGRTEERDLLLRAWQHAKSGEGRVVLLSGEPGIGKSRLLAELETAVAAEAPIRFRYFCSPLHQGSALYPIIARWRQEVGLADGDTAEQRLRKLEAMLVTEDHSDTDIALFAAMLGIPATGRYRPPELSPRELRQQTFAALERRLIALARKQPVLMLFEDAHWADHSSLELFDSVVNQITRMPVLLVISFRPGFAPPWLGRDGVSLMTLTRLSRRESTALASQIVETHVADTVIERIVERTDGVPLFIEELAKAVVETSSTASARAVPSTLQDSLVARLDRLPAGKLVAQVGAVIGRAFSHRLLSAVADYPAAHLQDGINQLLDAGLIFGRGAPPDSVYTFKHALVQEAAYESLLKPHRQHIHRRISETLRAEFPEWADAEPEIVAHHFTQGDCPAPAVEWWGKAGDLALRRSAFTEAIAHLETALRLTHGLEDGQDQRRAHLGLQIMYANALRVARGFGVPETQAAFTVARNLASSIDDIRERFPAYYGLWSGSFLRGDLPSLRDTATAYLHDAESWPGTQEAALGHRIYGMTCWFEGKFEEARQHLEQVLQANDSGGCCDIVHRFGQDLTSPAMAYLALTLWAQGFADKAVSLSRQAVACASKSNHVPTIAYSLGHAAWFGLLRRELAQARFYAEACLDLARKHGLAVWLATLPFIDGLVRAAEDPAAGLTEMHRGLKMMRLQHQGAYMPLFYAFVAETEAGAGRPEVALATVDRQIADIARTGQRWCLSTLHRIRGEILLRWQTPDTPEAKSAFLSAIDVARGQAANLFALEGAVSLARLWIREGKQGRARQLLSSIDIRFDEVGNCRTSREARDLLGLLSPRTRLGPDLQP